MKRNKIIDFYAQEGEANRLELEVFKLEGIRTKEIIGRYVQTNKLEILDIGGGAGFYSFWLQELGHDVILIDLSPENIELVRSHSEKTGNLLKAAVIGDAVDLHFPDNQFDLVLLMGPLYHLTDRAERIQALSEARRVLKPKGILIAVIISRYASLIDGFQRGLVLDNRFFQIMVNDLKTGVHLNETDNLQYFTTAYFHSPNEIKAEIDKAGLKFEKLIPVESFGWIVDDFQEKEKNPDYMQKLFDVIRMVEMNEDLLPISPHIIAVAQKE